MAQVDDVLDRLAREVAEKDATIAALTAAADGQASTPHPRRVVPEQLAAENLPNS
jgi:hypothetical protein